MTPLLFFFFFFFFLNIHIYIYINMYLVWRFLNHHFFNHHAGGCRYVLGVLQGLVCPYLNPHFYRGMREANLLVMLGMLAGHAGDVENDADDVDGLA